MLGEAVGQRPAARPVHPGRHRVVGDLEAGGPHDGVDLVLAAVGVTTPSGVDRADAAGTSSTLGRVTARYQSFDGSRRLQPGR